MHILFKEKALLVIVLIDLDCQEVKGLNYSKDEFDNQNCPNQVDIGSQYFGIYKIIIQIMKLTGLSCNDEHYIDEDHDPLRDLHNTHH